MSDYCFGVSLVNYPDPDPEVTFFILFETGVYAFFDKIFQV